MSDIVVQIEEVDLLLSGVKKTVALHFVEDVLGIVKDISKYYVIDALGRRVYIKTNNRTIAQDVADAYFGKNKYLVRCSGLEKISGTPNVRATESRRGQYVQRQKARVLNS